MEIYPGSVILILYFSINSCVCVVAYFHNLIEGGRADPVEMSGIVCTTLTLRESLCNFMNKTLHVYDVSAVEDSFEIMYKIKINS